MSRYPESEDRAPLFESDKPIEEEIRKNRRPLGELSEFVVTTMPSALLQIREEPARVQTLIDYVEQLSGEALSIIESLGERGRSNADLLLARLDILMLDAAIAHSGGVSGPNFENLLNRMAEITQRPPGLTYEDIVTNNISDITADPLAETPGDIRVFTTEEVGRTEADFYRGHQIIDALLQPSIEQFMDITEYPSNYNTAKIAEAIAEAIENFESAIKTMGVFYRNMNKDHFGVENGFRKYLMKHPYRSNSGDNLEEYEDSRRKDNELMGPSGAFTASIPLIEILFAGETLDESITNELLERLPYYPLEQQQDLLNGLAKAREGQSVLQLLRNSLEDGGSEIFLEKAKKLSEMLGFFRNTHLRAVQKHIPEVLRGEPGTSGELDVADFLERRQSQKHGLT